MKQKKIQLSFLILSILMYTTSYSQNCYQPFLQEGISAFNALDFEKAINQFKAAKICDDLPPANEVDEWISKAQNGYIDAIKKERTRAQSLALTAKSILELQKNNDATKAFRYGQYALGLEDNVESRAAFYESFYQLESAARRNFYVRDIKVLEGYNDIIRAVDFIDNGRAFFVTTDQGDTLKLFDLDGNEIGGKPLESEYTRQAFCEKTGLLLTAAKVEKKHFLYGYAFENGKLGETPLFEYESPTSDIEAMVVSKDGERIVISFYGGEVHIIDGKGNFLYALQKESDTAKFMAFSDDHHLALAYDNLIKILKLGVADYEIIYEGEEKGLYRPKVAISPDHNFVLINDNRRLRIIGTNGDSVAVGKDKPYMEDIGNFSADSRFVTFGNQVLDLKDKRLVEEFPREIREMKLSPDKRFVAGRNGSKTAQVWQSRGYGYDDFGVLGGHKDYIWQTNYSPDSTHLITSSQDQTVKIWNPKMKAASRIWGVGKLQQAFVMNNNLMVTKSQQNKLSFWNEAAERQIYYELPVKKIVAMSPDLKYLFANGDDAIEIWNLDVAKNKVDFKLSTTAVDSAQFASFSSDDKAVFFSKDNAFIIFQLWDLKTGKTYPLSGYGDELKRVKWSSDNKRVAAITRYGKLLIWNVSQGPDKAVVEAEWIPHPDHGCTNLNFSPDSQSLITCGGDNLAKVWDLEGHLLSVLRGHTYVVSDAGYSPNGKFIATASEDRTAKIWTSEGEFVVSLEGFMAEVDEVKFSQDNQYLVTSHSDGIIKIWPFDPQLIISYLESFGIPDLSVEEKQKYGIVLKERK